MYGTLGLMTTHDSNILAISVIVEWSGYLRFDVDGFGGNFFLALENGVEFPHSRFRRISYVTLGAVSVGISFALLSAIIFILSNNGMGAVFESGHRNNLLTLIFFLVPSGSSAWIYAYRFRRQYLGNMRLDANGLEIELKGRASCRIPWADVVEFKSNSWSGISRITTSSGRVYILESFEGFRWVKSALEFASQVNTQGELKELSESYLWQLLEAAPLHFGNGRKVKAQLSKSGFSVCKGRATEIDVKWAEIDGFDYFKWPDSFAVFVKEQPEKNALINSRIRGYHIFVLVLEAAWKNFASKAEG